jgi:hypothetical protein
MVQHNPKLRIGSDAPLSELYPPKVWGNQEEIGQLTVQQLYERLCGLNTVDPQTGDICGIRHDLFNTDTCPPNGMLYCPHDDMAVDILRTGVKVAATESGNEAKEQMRTVENSKSSLNNMDDGAQHVQEELEHPHDFSQPLDWYLDKLGVSHEAMDASSEANPLPILEEVKPCQRSHAEELGRVRDFAKQQLESVFLFTL